MSGDHQDTHLRVDLLDRRQAVAVRQIAVKKQKVVFFARKHLQSLGDGVGLVYGTIEVTEHQGLFDQHGVIAVVLDEQDFQCLWLHFSSLLLAYSGFCLDSL